MKQPKARTENPYLPKPFRVTRFIRESYDTVTLTIDMKISHEPGQFVQVSMPGIGECPISICSYSEEFVRLSVREAGRVTKAIGRLKKGDSLFVRGPYGKGYPMHYFKGDSIVMVGGGCGVAPLRGAIEYVERHREDFNDVYLFLGYRSPNDIIFRKELEEWKKRHNLTVTVDQNPEGVFCHDAKTGFVTNALKESPLDNTRKVALLCGPPIMMNTAIGILKEKGFNDDQIFLSTERLMYCGFGVCCHCMIQDKYTCVDGPVFRYDEIRGYKHD